MIFKKLNYVAGFVLLALLSSASMAHKSCKIKEQDGSSEWMWCQKHKLDGMIRCYAEVEYSNGDEGKIWGKECYNSYGDCWSSGKGAVEPHCSTR